MTTVLDTSALIAFLRGEEAGKPVAALLQNSEALVPAVCVFELLAGVRSPSHLKARSQLLDLTAIVPADRAIAARAASLFTDLRREGITADNEDLLVAATAIELNVPILTLNTRHFASIPGVRPVR